MNKKKRELYYASAILVLLSWAPLHALAQNSDTETPAQETPTLAIETAFMCEGVDDTGPINHAAAFPISIGNVFCFTSFDPVPKKTVISHHWFRQDRASTSIKLALNPPRWSTYSSVRLREEDKGPWRVEIRDEADTLLRTLRFSITD